MIHFGKYKGELKTCVLCGKKFDAKSTVAKYCSEECRKKKHKEYNSAYHKDLQEQERAERRKLPTKKAEKPKSNRREINDLSARARAMGISYGQLVQMEYMKEQKRKLAAGR